jgi:hypothetical protein
MQTITHTSYRAQDEDAAAYAEQPFWQFETVKEALYKYATQESSAMSDLRGQSFTITVAEDGLHVTVTDVTAEASAESMTTSDG